MTRYWFKPKRFWNWFAAYYPVSAPGRVTSTLLFVLLVYFFVLAGRDSHSASDTLLRFAPRALLVLILFDVLTRLTGEYPSWWRRQRRHDPKTSR